MTRTTQSAITALANSAARHAPGDIDGDGKSDLLLDNIALGQTAYWRMDGQTPVAYSHAFSKPEGYAQVASGDFNGDGKFDIVWARASDRSLLMWVGDGSGFRRARSPRTAGACARTVLVDVAQRFLRQDAGIADQHIDARLAQAPGQPCEGGAVGYINARLDACTGGRECVAGLTAGGDHIIAARCLASARPIPRLAPVMRIVDMVFSGSTME